MCNIAHFLLTFIYLFCLLLLFCPFCCLSNVLSVATGYLHFTRGVNKVSTYLLTCLAVTVSCVFLKVWQGNG